MSSVTVDHRFEDDIALNLLWQYGKLPFECTIPDSNQQSWLLLDIAVCLLRARAQIYARKLHILEESAAAANG
jgi:hypothetical protein